MKKLFAILLAVAMIATLSLPAFAATAIDENNATSASGKGADDYSIGVNGTYQAGAAATETISVDISWDAMTFTYTAGSSTYSPADHTTTTTSGSWSTNKPGITVKNHSNVGIEAGFSFAQASTLPSDTTITGKFYDKSGDGENATYTENTDKTLTLASGEDTTTDGETYTTPSATIYFGISGDPITENKTLGTITVKIAKDTSVKTYDDLVAALDAIKTTGGTVKLGADITVPEEATMSGVPSVMQITLNNTEGTPIVLNLGGHTVNGIIYISGSATSKIVLQNGTVKYTLVGSSQAEAGVVSVAAGVAELKNITVNATNIPALSTTTDTTVTDSELKGGLTNNGQTYTVLLTGNLTLSGEVTVDKMCLAVGFDLTLKSGCKYKINGATEATTVDTDTVYDSSSENLPDWIELLDIQ